MKMTFFDRLKRLLIGRGSGHPPHGNGGGDCPECKPISCMEALGRVHEYLDGEMDESDARDVAHHFEVCQRCYPHLRLEERFKEALRDSREKEKCPDHVRDQVLELLAAESGEDG